MKKLKELPAIIDEMIQDVEAYSVRNDAENNLLKELKHLAYDLEDAMDYYNTKALRKQRSRACSKPVRDFFSSNNNQLVFRSRISGMIKAVTESLASILEQKSILEKLLRGTNRISPSAYRETNSYNSLPVIGREIEKEKIVNMLTDDEESSNDTNTMKVIVIVGMGGLGKTALARHVFNDKTVKAYFGKPSMYWEVVGADFNPQKIMKSVLEQATGPQADVSGPQSVKRNLEHALSEKRFLLVLDDVWNENELQWGALEAALSCGARGSKVLVTTRIPKVSSTMNSFNTHQIQELSRDDSLSLFKQFAFGKEAANENLMEIGRKIVEKCGGVPLAVISLGSRLRDTRDENHWSCVLNSEVWQLEDEDKSFLPVLKLSYDALPRQSKKCFAFGSLFPKNYVMKRDKLIQLWTANDFDTETECNRIFDDLVKRSFFMQTPFHDSNFPGLRRSEIGYTMHDLMHDLARSVSEDEYYNLKGNRATPDIPERTYHLWIEYADWSNIVLFEKPLYLRTLLLRRRESHVKVEPDLLKELFVNVQLLPFVFSELKFLRALDLSENGIKEVPTSIGNLIHLRYLDLSMNYIEVLPDAMTLLQNLLYLNLTENNFRELPKKLRNMQSLRYLHFDSNNLTHMPPGLSRLTSLRSLSCFVSDNRTGSCSITELEDLKLRGEMEIKFFWNFKNYSCGGRKFLMNKDFNELSLCFSDSDTNDMSMLDDLCPNTSLKKLEISNYGSRQFPIWLMESQLLNLVEINLYNCNLCVHIPPFGNLQSLRKLVLRRMDGVTHMSDEFHGHGPIRGFPSLEELQIYRMTNLERWSESDGVDMLFPFLKILGILYCPKLRIMPRLPRIELLKLCDCSGSLLSGVGRMTSLSHLILENMKDMTSLPSGCLRNLTSLLKLKIQRCNELEFLPRDEMQVLTMVQSLSIEECNSLASFPLEVGCLPTLRHLCFKNSDSNTLQLEILVQILNSLHAFDIQICGKNVNLHGQLQHLHTLRILCISGSHCFFNCPFDAITSRSSKAKLSICCCNELESLMTAEPSTSSVLEHLGSSVLEHLFIYDISDLTTLPEWLQHLGSLRELSIYICPRLGSLPSGLRDLHSLNSLRIDGCSLQLERRCQMETDEDWPNISHVPSIRISREGTIEISQLKIQSLIKK